MRNLKRGVLALAILGAMPAAFAQTTSLTATDALRQFNVIVFGDLNSNSHVDGRGFVGGNAIGGGFMQHASAAAPSAYAGVTVLGSASGTNTNGGGITVGGSLSSTNINNGTSVVGGGASNVNFNGPAGVLGDVSNVNFNGGRLANGSPALTNTLAAARSTDFASLFTATSAGLSTLKGGASTVTVSGNKATFNAAPVNGVAVFDLTSIDDQIFALGEYAFNLNGATSVLFNSDNTNIRVGANFLGGSAQGIASSAIWNFYNASSVIIDRTFGGTVLAPKASFSNLNGSNLEGSLVAASLTQRGEIHLGAYTGVIPQVPEPATYAMMLGGLAMLGMARRRRGAARP